MNSWQDTPVLLTGATGFIGANVTRRLVDLGARVHAIVRPSSSLARIEDVASRLSIHRVDVTDEEAMNAAVRAASPAIVFHLAAHGAASHDLDAAQLFRTNVLGTLNLLQ